MDKSSKETRMGRLEERSTFKLDSMYYKVVASLVAILVVLIVYIFWQKSPKDNNVDDNSSNGETIVQEEKNQNVSNDSEENNDDNQSSSKENENNKENNQNNEVIETNAPLDKSHETSYEEGSSDMTAIIDLSKKATGLGEDMYPVWIGNNGPGKVQATVSNKDNSKQFVIDLQYGEGAWHVTNVEEIN